MFGFMRTILGLKQNANDKFFLGRKLLHGFNNSLGVKYVRAANTVLDKFPQVEGVISKLPYVGMIPKGVRMANQALDKAQQLEQYADRFSDATGFGRTGQGN